MTDEQPIRAAQDESARHCLQCGQAFTPMTDKEIFCSKECHQAHEDRDWEYSDGGTFRQCRDLHPRGWEGGLHVALRRTGRGPLGAVLRGEANRVREGVMDRYRVDGCIPVSTTAGRRIVTCSAVLLVWLCSLLAAQTLSPVSIADEPHHKLLLENANVRVFAVELPRLQSTLPIQHDSNYIVVYLGKSTVSRTVGGSMPVGYEHYDGEIRRFYAGDIVSEHNEAVTTYRNITVETPEWEDGTCGYYWQDYGCPPDRVSPSVLSDTTSAQSVDMGGVVARRFRIMPTDNRATGTTHRPTLLIALSDLELSGDGQKIVKSRGEAEWLKSGMPPNVKNTGSKPCRFALLEF